MLNQLLPKWNSIFGKTNPDIIVRAPGRVNIIGEHTDYNEGLVMPGAMSKSVYILLSRSDNQNHWVSMDFNEELCFTGDMPINAPLWSRYVEGAIRISGLSDGPLNILIGGDLPIGAGVSSSSSLVCGIVYALQQLSGTAMSREEVAKLGSRVEREIIGLQGGIMDQYAIMLSHTDKVMMLDCRDRTYAPIQASIPGAQWLLINTKVKHQLINSDYNQRAAECRRSVEVLQKTFPEVKSLRDVTSEMLTQSNLDDVLRTRSQFVITENERVVQMSDALSRQDPVDAGRLLKGSHHGLQHDYEVSCEELDHLAILANHSDGVYGARMMGGGFGGCVICLVETNAINGFLLAASFSYKAKFGITPEAIRFELSEGVERVG